MACLSSGAELIEDDDSGGFDLVDNSRGRGQVARAGAEWNYDKVGVIDRVDHVGVWSGWGVHEDVFGTVVLVGVVVCAGLVIQLVGRGGHASVLECPRDFVKQGRFPYAPFGVGKESV